MYFDQSVCVLASVCVHARVCIYEYYICARACGFTSNVCTRACIGMRHVYARARVGICVCARAHAYIRKTRICAYVFGYASMGINKFLGWRFTAAHAELPLSQRPPSLSPLRGVDVSDCRVRNLPVP